MVEPVDQGAWSPQNEPLGPLDGIAAVSSASDAGGQGMVRIARGQQHRWIWPVHLPGWLALGWQVAHPGAAASEAVATAVVAAGPTAATDPPQPRPRTRRKGAPTTEHQQNRQDPAAEQDNDRAPESTAAFEAPLPDDLLLGVLDD